MKHAIGSNYNSTILIQISDLGVKNCFGDAETSGDKEFLSKIFFEKMRCTDIKLALS